MRRALGISIMISEDGRKTLITFLLKEFFIIPPDPATHAHAMNHHDGLIHGIVPYPWLFADFFE
jgi:hypothetical protein